MNIKEQEKKLRSNLNFEIVLTGIIWLAAIGFMSYRLWRLNTIKEFPTMLSNNVPTIKQANLEILKSSIKNTKVNNLPVVRMEPFD